MGITSTLAKAAVQAVSKIVGSKAVLIVAKDTPEQIPVQFNPAEYSITDGTTYAQKERRKKDEPVVNYSGTQLSRLTVKLYFNSDEFFSASGAISGAVKMLMGGEEDDITKPINKITALTRIDGNTHKPPGCIFVWGSLQFIGYVESVGVSYTMFDKTGKPLRAVVDLAMRGFNGAASERESPFLSPDRTKARTLTEDTSIWGIAEKEYGDAREWRRIADANDIMNPLDIPVGRVLRVPSINDGD
ncbi:MAG: hypothetical protein IKN17_13575 [Ruminococcus sp.]|nr:hypothetical protein [Ruminococcus sp.]